MLKYNKFEVNIFQDYQYIHIGIEKSQLINVIVFPVHIEIYV